MPAASSRNYAGITGSKPIVSLMSRPLLPQDRYIAEILGLTEEEMRWFKAEVARKAQEAPAPLVVAGAETAATFAIISAVSSAISIGLTIIATFFAPRPRSGGGLETVNKQGATLSSPTTFSPTYGFESIQDIAPLGDPIPRVYAKREFLDGRWYGGVRVSTPLLWSQVWSLGGSQMLRAIFLVSEGRLESVHPTSFAIGNNTLGAYAFNSSRQRISVYFKKNGGRLAAADYLSGASPSKDIGASGNYFSDIYRVDRGNNAIARDFCGAYKPSTSTLFGVYSPIANGLGYRENPQVRPLRQLKTEQDDDVTRYRAMDDAGALAEAWKSKYVYSSKTGIVSTSRGGGAGDLVSLQPGDTFRLRLSGNSDGVLNPNGEPPVIRFSPENTDNVDGSLKGDTTLLSVGSAVGGRQRQYDSSLVEGELYKVGSCLAILVDRSGEFISESFFGPNLIEDGEPSSEAQVISQDLVCTFEVVRSGVVGVVGRDAVSSRFFTSAKYRPRLGNEDAARIWEHQTVGTDYDAGQIGSRHYTASSFPQIFRCALGSFAVNRPSRYFEVGIKSQVGMSIQGMCNFSDIPSKREEFALTGAELAYGGRGAGSYSAGPRTVTASPSGGSGSGMTVSIQVQSDGSIPSVLYTEPFPVANPYVTVVNPGTGYKEGDQLTVSGSVIGPSGAPNLNITVIAISQESTGNEIVSPGYEVINFEAADSLDTRRVDKKLANSVFQSGTISIPEKRYTFFKIGVRERRNDSSEFRDTGNTVFGFAGSRSTSAFNFIRFSMNKQSSWEVRFEPVTSWEIRYFDYRTILVNTDFGSSTPVSGYSFDWGTIYVQGERVSNSRRTFIIEPLQPQKEFGISWTEGSIGNPDPDRGTYIDTYGRAAEFFVYDEITTTCQQSPEHEIAYVNIFTPNQIVPEYDRLSILGVNIKSSSEWGQFSQFSAYVTGGIIVDNLRGGDRRASHLFPDILYDLLTDKIYGLGNEISTAQIDRESFEEAAQFCWARRYFYDGVRLNDTNWRQWAADTAASHLLLFVEKGGIFYLQRAMPRTPTIAGIFTPGNCMSIDFQTIDLDQREPFAVSVKYREETYSLLAPASSTDQSESYGLFPLPREALVYSKEWGYSTIESVDLSDFCTSKNHAVAAAKFIIAARRFSDHSVKIKTTIDAIVNPLSPGDFIKVAIDRTYYNEFRNGVVLADGTLVSTTSLQNGTYRVLYWNGNSGTEVQEGNLVVTGGGLKATPVGIVFTVKSNESLTRTYRIESIQPSEDGYEIDAVHSPTLTNGTSLIYDDWSTPANWSVID